MGLLNQHYSLMPSMKHTYCWPLFPVILSATESLKIQHFPLSHGWIIFYYTYIFHIFFTHSSVDTHFGCFHISVIVKNAAVNMGCRYLFGILFSFPLDLYPEVGL